MVTDENLKPILMETDFKSRIDLIKYSINGSILIWKRPDCPFSIHHIFNRIMILLQTPVTFILYNRKLIDGNYRFVYEPLDFIQNFNHKKILKKTLNENLEQIDDRKCLLPAKTDSLFRVYDSNYFIQVYSISRSIKNDFSTPIFELIDKTQVKLNHITNVNNYIVACLQEVFSIKNKAMNEFYKVLTKESLNSTIERNQDIINKYKNLKFYKNKVPQPLINSSCLTTRKRIKSIGNKVKSNLENGFMDQIYKKAKQSPIEILQISQQKKTYESLPNMLLFRRVYNLMFPRDGSKKTTSPFNYSVELILSKNQRNDIAKYFNKFLDENKSIKRIEIHKLIENDEHVSLIKSLENEFISRISKNNSYLFELLEKVNNESICLSDATMISGIISYRKPFVNGLINLINEHKAYSTFSEIPNSKIASKFLSKIALLHLIYGMLPKTKNVNEKNITLAIFPIEVSGHIALSCGYVLSDDNPRFIDQPIWQSRFYYYLYTVITIEKSIRTATKVLYIEEILKSFKFILYRELISNVASSEHEIMKIAEKKINNHLLDFCRFTPYGRVEFSIDFTENSTRIRNITLFGKYVVTMKISINPFYDIINGSYLEKSMSLQEKHIKKELISSIKSLELRIYDYLGDKDEK